MVKIFSIINNKGGTGKTTTALNLGAALSKLKKRILLIDFDSQCNLTTSLGLNKSPKSIGDLLLNQAEIKEVIQNQYNMALISGTDQLLDFEYKLNSEPGGEYLLKESLEKIKDNYDYILIDCAPNLGIFSINSMVSADYFIVPMQAENFAFIGLDKILQMSDKVKKRLNPNLEMAGVLIIRLAHKTKFSQAVFSNITSNSRLKEKLFSTIIRQDIALMESAAFGKPVFEYAPKSRGAEDYFEFAKELIKKYG